MNLNDIMYYYEDEIQVKFEKIITEFQYTDNNDESQFDQINLYKFSQDDVTVEWEGVPRLCQAVLQVVTIETIDLQKYQNLFERFHPQKIQKDEYIDHVFERLLHLIKRYVRPESSNDEKDWIKQRNVCLLLALVVGKYVNPVSFNLDGIEILINYLLGILNKVVAFKHSSIDHYLKEAVLFALITLEKIAIVHYFNVVENKKDRLAIEILREADKNCKTFLSQQTEQHKSLSRLPDFSTMIENLTKLTRIELDHNWLKKIMKKLIKLLTKYPDSDPIGNSKFNPIQYQIGFYARYCLDNVMDGKYFVDPDFKIIEQQVDESFKFLVKAQYVLTETRTADDLLAKVSSDGLSARNYKLDKFHFVPVKSLFEVTSGVYFYEVTLITDGPMRIGWSTIGSNLSEQPKAGIGEDKFSIGFDGFKKSVWHQGEHKVPKIHKWNVSDVVGCLIDIEHENFLFFLNSKKITFVEFPYFSPLPYFATVSLSPHQQCYFNFGQKPFKHPPKNFAFKNFHSCTQKNVQKYRIIVPTVNANNFYYWENKGLAENDDKLYSKNQSQFNQIVMKILQRTIKQKEMDEFFSQNRNIIEKHGFIMLNQTLTMPKVYKCNTLLEHFGTLYDRFYPTDHRSSNGWDQNKPHLKELYCLFVDTINFSKYNSDSRRMDLSTLLKIINVDLFGPQVLNEDEVSLIALALDIDVFLHDGFVLWSIILLDYIVLNKPNLLNDLNKPTLIDALEKRALKCDVPKFRDSPSSGKSNKNTSNIKSYLQYQISFCAQWTLDNVIKPTSNDRITVKCLKKFDNKMSFRNDFYPETSIRTPIESTSGISFYEVTLITGGAMKFGWSTRKYSYRLGATVYSIGINEFKRVLHAIDKSKDGVISFGQVIQVEHDELTCWKSGDVIGCFADLIDKKFAFYVNGKEIRFDEKDVHFSKQPYYVFATLSSHQHCHFNFGQEPFSFPPPKVQSIKDYYSTIQNELKFQESETAFKMFVWFKQSFEEVLFKDSIQERFHQWFSDVEKHLKMLENSDFNVESSSKSIMNDFKNLIQISQAEIRFCQTIVQKLGVSGECDESSVQNIFAYITNIFKTDDDDFSFFCTVSDIHELIYSITSISDCDVNTKYYQRNICMVLEEATSQYPEYHLYIIFEFAFNYLQKTINTTRDNLTLLYAIICLDNLQMLKRIITHTTHYTISNQTWETIFELAKRMEPFDPYCSNASGIINYQVGFCANWILRDAEKDSPIKSIEIEFISTLDPEVCFDVKLSPDLLSARCDLDIKAVYSKFSTTQGVHYYETILFSSNSMYIGWYEENKKQFVIYNGTDGNVTYEKQTYLTKRKYWHTGDIVGCLIDCERHKILFYLNGEQIWSSENVCPSQPVNSPALVLPNEETFSISNSYKAGVILTKSQHCYFNFGQCPFKYPPKVRFQDFNGNTYFDNLCQLCYEKPDVAISRCNHLKSCLECLVDLISGRITCPEC